MSPNLDIDVIWNGDFMGRRSEADYLTNYLQRRYTTKPDERGYVIAINADWGMGKTFFLDRWGKQLRHQNHPHIYFDAWANDYTPQPLIAFIAELDKGLAPYFKCIPEGQKLRRAFLDTAKTILKPAGKAMGYAIAKHLAGLSVDQVKDLIDEIGSDEDNEKQDVTAEIGKSLQQAVTQALNQHSSTQVAIAKFKEKLALLVNGLKNESIQLPIFIFVDELDRCRPNYAIELLEGIKHLFGVPGIYFVVATNITQLGESTRAVYGPSFDGQRYLKRFFDIEYSLPEPSKENFAKELLAESAIPKPVRFYSGDLARSLSKTEDEINAYLISIYAKSFDLSLRDLQQVMRIVEASVLTLASHSPHIHPLLYLSMLYHKDQSLFRQYSRNLNAGDNLLLAVSNGHRGITLPGRVRDPFNSQRDPDRNISVHEIFSLYSDTISRPIMQIYDINRYDFPNNLHWGIYDENSSDRVFDLQRYINLVSRAGAFS